MKKRHVTELTGRELNAVFAAAVSEAREAAAQRGIDLHGRHEYEGEATLIVQKPDGSIVTETENQTNITPGRKRSAA
jgi:hypothetical protein